MTPYELGAQYAIKLAVPIHPPPGVTRAAGNALTGLEHAMSGKLPHALEVAGLATLAAPSFNDMIDPEFIQSNRRRMAARIAEVTGLGMLSLPSLYHLARKVPIR